MVSGGAHIKQGHFTLQFSLYLSCSQGAQNENRSCVSRKRRLQTSVSNVSSPRRQWQAKSLQKVMKYIQLCGGFGFYGVARGGDHERKCLQKTCI